MRIIHTTGDPLTGSNKNGFTLIELLVVIAIIAILASLVFAAMHAAKQSSVTTSCLNNLKHIAFAFTNYCADNCGRMPYLDSRGPELRPPNWCGSDWVNYDVDLSRGSIWPYVRNAEVFLCKADKGIRAVFTTQGRYYPLSYSVNFKLQCARPDCLGYIRTSRMMMLIHENRRTMNDGYMVWTRPESDSPSNVHNEGTTIAFVDGHVEHLLYDEAMKRQLSGEWGASIEVFTLY